MKHTGLAVLAALIAFAPATALRADPVAFTLTMSNHRFTPNTLTVPAGQRVRITLINQDAATEEFDSHDLRVEKLVTPRGRATFFIGPLRPGSYAFMGEFHRATAQGRIIAVEQR